MFNPDNVLAAVCAAALVLVAYGSFLFDHEQQPPELGCYIAAHHAVSQPWRIRHD